MITTRRWRWPARSDCSGTWDATSKAGRPSPGCSPAPTGNSSSTRAGLAGRLPRRTSARLPGAPQPTVRGCRAGEPARSSRRSVTPHVPPCRECCSPSKESPGRTRALAQQLLREAHEQFTRGRRRLGRGGDRLRSHGDRSQERRRQRCGIRSAAPPRRRSARWTTPGDSPRPSTTSAGVSSSSVGSRRGRGRWRRPSTWRPSADLYNTVQWALADLGIAQLHLGNREVARRAVRPGRRGGGARRRRRRRDPGRLRLRAARGDGRRLGRGAQTVRSGDERLLRPGHPGT